MGNIKKEKITSPVNYFVSHKNIIHNVRALGNWDFEPEIEVYLETKSEKILNELKDKFSDTITISKEYKFVYF